MRAKHVATSVSLRKLWKENRAAASCDRVPLECLHINITHTCINSRSEHAVKFTSILRIHFPSIASTNQWAKENHDDLELDTLRIVTADRQTAGRGRFSRPWISAIQENLCATFAFVAPPSFHNFANLSQVMAISASEVIELMGFKTSLKWPNDILIEKKKVGGILTETSKTDDKTIIVIGIGLNINMPKETLENIDQPATSLFFESGKKFCLEEILNALVKCFVPKLEILESKGFLPFLKDYKHKLIHKKGDILSILNGNNRSVGAFVDIDENGFLLLQQEGKTKNFFAGDLF